MKTYNTLIVDDEAKLRKVLQIKLEQYCEGIKVIGTAANIDEAYEKITKLKPQLLFLDISMPGGSGFDLLERFEQLDFEIIFVTGFNDYILDALKVSAVDYLLKPVVTEDLIQAVQRGKKRIDAKVKMQHYALLKHNINNIGEQDTKIAVTTSNSYEFIKVGSIVRCEGYQKYTRLYLVDGRSFVSSYNLGTFKDMLENYGFYSPHKSHLINTKLILRYLKEGIVVMKDASEIPVARRKKEDFIEHVLKGLMI